MGAVQGLLATRSSGRYIARGIAVLGYSARGRDGGLQQRTCILLCERARSDTGRCMKAEANGQ
jgi:hypothetical protein